MPIGNVQRVYSSRGKVSYEVEVTHPGLGKFRRVRETDQFAVFRVAQSQLSDWERMWDVRQSRIQRIAAAAATKSARDMDRQEKEQYREEQTAEAATQTGEAAALMDTLNSLLQQTLTKNDALDWELLKTNFPFPEPRPSSPPMPPKPHTSASPREPQATDADYQPSLSLIDRIVASRRLQKEADATQRYAASHAQWKAEIDRLSAVNLSNRQAYETQVASVEADYRQQIAQWEKRRAIFTAQQDEQNKALESQREEYYQGLPAAVVSYCEMVLSRSDYPDLLPKSWELDYNEDTKSLIVDYALPAPNLMPTLIEVKYQPTKDAFTEKHLTPVQSAKLYDDVVYQIALRTIHEMYESDTIAALSAVTFNGYVSSIDRSTGNETTACILSLQTIRADFLAINLAHVDPRACFKQLKGVGSSKMHSVTPVAPIMRIRRDDGRFVAAHDVTSSLDDGYNLAAMGWEDFEHLIRQIFESEFASSGGEVKVTQASRDGGVDAIAFDADPIRGGKIVIQAKRYTNTVDVAAVRDLYGTVMNEGATKGILVTTSDYGPDSYAFANGKPLTLMNGANLLHLLEKHGHRAKIDLKEARTMALGRTSK